MKCLDPYVTSKGEAYGCGRCLPCRIKRRRIWTARIMLEASQWQNNCFATISYADKYLPLLSTGPALPTLVPRDLQLFLKRLRWEARPTQFRFFGVGEYGDRSWRPHYHVALFNFPTCFRGRTLRSGRSSRPVWDQCCDACRVVGRAWGKGDVDLGMLEPHSAGYVAGYVTKKLTGAADARLEGRYPEFARMSLRPGIGSGVVSQIAATLVSHNFNEADVPTVLRSNGKLMPLGRYLRRRLRVMLGRDEKCPPEVLAALQEEMYDLRSRVEATLTHPTVRKYRREAIKNALIDANMSSGWKAHYIMQNAKWRQL